MQEATVSVAFRREKRFADLKAWQACHDLVLRVYRLTAPWPVEERYGLTSQCRRAAVSAASNIAEGSAKLGPREFGRYLDVALGSLSELSYLVALARDLGIIDRASWQEVEILRDHAGKLVWGLYHALRRERGTHKGRKDLDRATDRS